MNPCDTNSETISPRIHILVAREAPYGLVIRRGPSKHVCFVGWDRTKDEFSLGQWFKGRISERRSDLSPDGRHVIYFASKGYKAWTAISRAPYLKAIGLWEQEHHFNGGGLFVDNKGYALNAGFGYTEVETPENLRELTSESERFSMGECPVVYYPRLERDGWQLVTEEKRYGGSVSIFEKPIKPGWTIRKICHSSALDLPGKGCYWDEHELVDFGTVIPCPDWEWADMDSDRLTWIEHGRLFAERLTGDNILDDTIELRDFNAMTFEAIKAPY